MPGRCAPPCRRCPATAPVTCCSIWSSCTTPGWRLRCRCRSRPARSTRTPAGAGWIRTGRWAGRRRPGPARPPIPARTRTRPMCGSGVGTARSRTWPRRTASSTWPSGCGSRSCSTNSGPRYDAGRPVMTASVEDVTDPVVPFDACGPLPTGTTVLEASAGTGKTHAIGDLVTRYVAEGVARPEQLLVITFGRAASQELRERVRGHLVAAERALARPDRADAPVLRLLATGSAEEVRLRRDRLRAALATYDASTILTTHQFCQFVLTGLGVAGDADPDVELVETLDDLVVQVVDDLFVGAFARRELEPVFDRTTALM